MENHTLTIPPPPPTSSPLYQCCFHHERKPVKLPHQAKKLKDKKTAKERSEADLHRANISTVVKHMWFSEQYLVHLFYTVFMLWLYIHTIVCS